MKPGERWEKKYSYALLPLFTAFLLILSFAAWQKGLLGWICLLPLFFYLHQTGSSWQKCFWGGFGSGLVFFLHHYAYISLSVDFFFSRSFSILIVFAAALYSALFWGLFSITASFILQNKRILLPALALSSAWVLGEYLRARGFLGHTGGFLGYSQEHCLPLLQCVSLYGYWGLSFLMVFAQALFFLFWRSRQQKIVHRCSSSSNSNKEIIISVFIFLALLGGGISLPALFPLEKNDKPLRIALIQGNIPQAGILDSSLSLQNFQKYLHLSRQADALYAPLDLIVWPETVFSANLGEKNYEEAAKEIAALAADTKAAILFGAVYEEEEKEKEEKGGKGEQGEKGEQKEQEEQEEKNRRQVFNSILLQKKDQSFWEEKRYDKIRLVPFAEYFPFPDLLQKILHMDISLGTYTPGRAVQSFTLADSCFGGIICFESYFAQPARSVVQKGGKHLFVLTNDAWFLASDGLAQHARAATFRALETGVGVTQVANTGRTVSYDPYGRKVISLPILQEGIAFLETEMPRRQTLYLLWGNYFLYPCLLLFIVGCRIPFCKAFLKKRSL